MQEFDPHVLDEKPIPPPADFSKKARVRSMDEYEEMCAKAAENPEAFWGEEAKNLDWFEPPVKTLEWDLPHAKWFVGGKLNVAHNCLDRHLEKNGNKPALLWEAEDGATLQLTYAELHERVCKFANVLLSLGVKPTDCVAIYMPMIPELPIAMLACARVGAVHSVVFGGFSAVALADRIADAKSKILITADGGYRRGKVVPLKETADVALDKCPTIEKSIVVRRTGEKVGWKEGRDLWWHDLVEKIAQRLPRARPSIPSIRSISSTPPVRPANRRASCILPPATCCKRSGARGWSSIFAMTTSIGAPPTSAGSPATATSSTARSQMPRAS